MTTWQHKVFAWFYTALDTCVAGGATAFLLAVNNSYNGQQLDLRLALQNAGLAALVNLVMYLRQSPLPQLLQQKREPNEEREKLQDEIAALRAELALRDGELRGGTQ